MLDKKLLEILAHEGVAAIVSCHENEPHVVNTWHTYVTVTDDGRLLVPAGGMTHTEKFLRANNKVLLSVGSKEVAGLSGSMGAGFCLEGTAEFLTAGPDYDLMIKKFSWLSRVLAITITSCTETM